jgi:CDP-2,3-bis-(O-geranylgeranyl)-sn-glycerol synthase
MGVEDALYAIILYPVIYILPAYVSNGAPVIFGGGVPIDMNRKFRGKPIFGKHKTIRGLISGILSGFVIASLLSYFIPGIFLAGISMSIGTHIGDLAGSFIKRRQGKKSGERTLLLDQYPFLIFALLFAFPFGGFPSIWGIIFLVILTGLLHRSTNAAAHSLKIKEVPW